jgi:class 3 adenylate cyclase
MWAIHAILLTQLWNAQCCGAAGIFLRRGRSIAAGLQKVNTTSVLDHDLLGRPFEEVLDEYLDGVPIAGNQKTRFFWSIAVTSYLLSGFFVYATWYWFSKHHSGKGDTNFFSSRARMQTMSNLSKSTMDPSQLEESEESEEEELVDAERSVSSSSVMSRRTSSDESERRKKKKEQLDRWSKETMPDRLQTAALTLLIIGCLMCVYMAMRFLDRPQCAPFQNKVHIPEMVALGCGMALVYLCVQNPSQELYWPTLMLWLFYIPACQLPPFNLSCEMLQEVCHHSDHWRVEQAVDHADCSLQGQTAQQIFLTVFLLVPWLLPDGRMLHLMWVWLFSVFVVWSVAYIRYSPDGRIAYNSKNVVSNTILLACALFVAYLKKHFLEKSQRARFKSDLANRENSMKLYNILEYMLPDHVIPQLLMLNKGESWSESMDTVTIFFLVIDDFDAVVHKYSSRPSKLLQFLNDSFTQIDKICSMNDVTKIETVGEEYVACVGNTPKDRAESKEHGHTVVLKRLFNAASQILDTQTSIKYKCGMHTGPIVAGVIGNKLPRYRLFGDTINTSARMMQKGLVGQVQFGTATHEVLPEGVPATYRGTVEMKGKGQVEAYLFAGYSKDEKAGEASAATTEAAGSAGLELPSTSLGTSTGSAKVRKSVGFNSTVSQMGDKLETTAQLGEQTSFMMESKEPPVARSSGLLSLLLRRHSTSGDKPIPGAKSAATTNGAPVDFGDVVKRMQVKTEQIADQKEHLDGVEKKKRRVLSEKHGFTEDMERDWFAEYLDETFGKKMHPRIDKWILGLFAITIIEVLWNTPDPHHEELSGWDKPHADFGTHSRWVIFCICRVLVFGMLIGMRRSCNHDNMDWISDNPRTFQSMYVGTSCVCILLLYLSYHVMIVGRVVEADGRLVAPQDQIFTLLFVLVFFVIIRDSLLFGYSLAYIPLAFVIVGLSNIRSESGIYFPLIGQVLFIIIAMSNSVLSHAEEQSLRARFKAKHAMESTRDRVQHILKNMIPPAVLAELKTNPFSSPSHKYEAATIAQSDLCGFTALCSVRTPPEVVGFISEIFGLFDDLSRRHHIYKIETVGDAYIAGQAEHPLTSHNSPTQVVIFGMGMVIAVNDWSRKHGHKVRCRVGVNHGACLGGIVGSEMQRYHIFGSLMQGIEILESTAPEGGVQISPSCFEACKNEWAENKERKPLLEFTKRTKAQLVTSKGEVHEYEEVGGATYLVVDEGLNSSG